MSISLEEVNIVNIAFDMSFVQGVSNYRGIGRYSKNLIEHVSILGKDLSFFYFYPDINNGPDALKSQLQKFLRHNQIELFHILSPFEYKNQAMMNREWYGKTKLAVTLYDIIPHLYKDQYLHNEGFEAFYYRVIEFIKSCDVILAISETTKQDAVQHLGMDPNKIVTIMGGIDSRFKVLPAVNRAELLARYGIVKPYVMCTGGMDFRKNMSRLIEGFSIANRQLNHAYQLVLCCSVTSEDRQQLMEIAQRSGVAEDIVITGFVPDNEITDLYNAAEVFAFPSLYEGLGFPVLEAMACGAPVLTSNCSSLAEIAGDAARLVNPHYSSDIGAGLYELFTQPAMRAELQQRGFRQAAGFRWETVAGKVIASYKQLIRRKIAIFTPLPPIRSGIADYMESILPLLARNYDCDFYVDDDYAPNIPPGPTVRIYNHRLFHDRAQDYDAVIYQMGNSGFHIYMIPYLRVYSGIVVLHDLNLHAMSIEWTLSKDDVETYTHVLSSHYGQSAKHVAAAIRNGQIERPHEQIVINKYFLNKAKEVIVHSRYCKDSLNSDGVRNVRVTRLPAKAAAVPDRTSCAGGNKFVFASFGYATPHKQIETAIRAFGRLVCQGITNIEYRLVGPIDPQFLRQVRSLIREERLESYVKVLGHVDDAAYQRHLSETDAAINLRYPTYGESSASLLDILSSGIPAIISNIGAFSEFPEETAVKLPPVPDDDTTLAEAMLRLYKDEALRAKLSQHARVYVAQHHSAEEYIRQLGEAIENTAKQRLRDIPTILWPLEEEFVDEEEPAFSEPQPPVPVQTETVPPEAPAEAADPPASTIRLSPNRMKQRRLRRRTVTYCSFELPALPQETRIDRAVLTLPLARPARRVAVHRIRRSWSERSARLRKPLVYRKPIFSARGQRGTVQWDCTPLVHLWMANPDKNHGICVPLHTHPHLELILGTEG